MRDANVFITTYINYLFSGRVGGGTCPPPPLSFAETMPRTFECTKSVYGIVLSEEPSYALLQQNLSR